MKILNGKSIEDFDCHAFKQKIKKYTSVVIDIGTGEGEFIYKEARRNPEIMYIGLDSCADSMTHFSVKICKKPEKGGLNNVIYVVDDANTVSDDLAGAAEKIFIHLPWGSLRDGIIKGEQPLLENLTKVSRRSATLEIMIAYSSQYEEREMASRNLPELTMQYLKGSLKDKFKQCGIHMTEVSALNNEQLKNIQTKWAKKLAYGKNRDIFHLKCRINK